MIRRALYRFRQFLFAMSASMNDVDWHLVGRYLNIDEMALFKRLPSFEQKHCVVVAEKIEELIHGRHDVDERKAIKLGLLHDIGKIEGHLLIFQKSILTIIRFLLRPLYDFLADRGEDKNSSRIFRKFYIHKHHGAIGAELLEKLGEDREIVICTRLHDFPTKHDSMYMKLLAEADSTN
ncbi:MAG: HDIG domain-containing protein [Candidatus Saganbacteria bacterium]|nr:HDIG domain-containing protein [Candidatus Saganbacteria bacterium]